MIRFIIIFIFFYNWQDNESWKLKNELHFNSDFVRIDHLQNIYTVKNHVLKKFNKDGEKLNEYSNNFTGQITSIDISDPLKILLFYEEYNQLLFLDNELAEIGSPILLDDLNFGIIKLACTSSQGGFWLYSQQLQQVLYFNSDLQLAQKSLRLSSIIDKENEPNYLIEHNNLVYLNSPEIGIFIFDIFGNYIKKILIPDLNDIQLKGENIVYSNKNYIIQYNQDHIKYDTLTFNIEAQIQDIRIMQNMSVLKFKDGIQIYRFE